MFRIILRFIPIIIVLFSLSGCGGESNNSSPSTYTIGGTVSGLSGSGLVLKNNGGDDLNISGNGGFTFSAAITDGNAYAVTVSTQPSSPAQTCSVTNGSGTVSGSNVTNVSISCVGKFTLTTNSDWVAFQDGPGGTWTKVTPDGGSGQVYTLAVTDPDGKYGIAFHTNYRDSFDGIVIMQATLSDADSLIGPGLSCTTNPNGTIVNLDAGSSARVYASTSNAHSIVEGGTFNFNTIPCLTDIFGLQYNGSNVITEGQFTRDSNVSGSAIRDFDFSQSADITGTTAHTFSATGADYTGVDFVSNNGTYINLGSSSWQAFNDGTITGDRYRFGAADNTSGTVQMKYIDASTDPGNQSTDISNISALSGVTIADPTTTGLSYTPDASSPPLRYWYFYYEQGAPITLNWDMFVTVGWMGAATSYSRPDLTGVTGFTWEFASSTPVSVQVSAGMINRTMSQVIADAGQDFSKVPFFKAGVVYEQATTLDSFTP